MITHIYNWSVNITDIIKNSDYIRHDNDLYIPNTNDNIVVFYNHNFEEQDNKNVEALLLLSASVGVMVCIFATTAYNIIKYKHYKQPRSSPIVPPEYSVDV